MPIRCLAPGRMADLWVGAFRRGPGLCGFKATKPHVPTGPSFCGWSSAPSITVLARPHGQETQGQLHTTVPRGPSLSPGHVACFQDPGDLAAGAVPPRAERQAAHWCPAEQRGGRFVPSGHATLGTLSHLVVTAAGCHAVLHVGQEGIDEPHVAPHGLAASVGRAQVPEGEGRQQWGTRSRVRGHDGRADLGGGAADRTGG